MIPDTELEKWRKLVEAATRGPWTDVHISDRAIFGDQDSDGWSEVVRCPCPNSPAGSVRYERWRKDAAFIVTARTAVPALLDEVERLKRDLKMYCGDMRGTWRCFQCDQVFTNRRDAQRHFGHWPGDKPMCVNEHAGDESYWRDKYTKADEYNGKMRQMDFKRWQDEKGRAEKAEAEVARLRGIMEHTLDVVQAWCDAVDRDSSWDSWDHHYKGFAYGGIDNLRAALKGDKTDD